MAQKRLNEEQMREYVEREVRKALTNEGIGKKTILQESIEEVIAENMADEGLMDIIKTIARGQGGNKGNGFSEGGSGFQIETLIGGLLGRLAAPLISKICTKLGINTEGPSGQLLVNAGSTAVGAIIGDKVGKKKNPISIGGKF